MGMTRVSGGTDLAARARAASIATSERTVFEEFRECCGVRGRRVLEIGGCLAAELVESAQPSAWVSVDPRNEDGERGSVCRSLRGPAQLIPFADDSFDLAFSANAFHHVSALGSALFEIRRVLKPGGVLFASFGPIWSAPDGSHVEDVICQGRSWNFWERRLVPDWFHLVYSCRELVDILASAIDLELARAIGEYVYLSNWINRLEYRDYVRIIEGSGFQVETFAGVTEFDYDALCPSYRNPLAYKVDDWLAARGAALEEYRYRDLKIVLRK